jgi:hypothetical protein
MTIYITPKLRVQKIFRRTFQEINVFQKRRVEGVRSVSETTNGAKDPR